MDQKFVRYFEDELLFVKEMGAEFARAFPKIAGRLGMEGMECADPYVERLIEGFAFLSARVQLKLDAEYPVMSQHLMEVLYPGYLAPLPSMAIARLAPDMAEGALADGLVVPRGSILKSQQVPGEQTACEFRTAHDVTLWPLAVTEVEYIGHAGALTGMGLSALAPARAAVRIRLSVAGGLRFSDLKLDALPLFLNGSDAVPYRLYESLLAQSVGVALRPLPANTGAPFLVGDAGPNACGLSDAEALLPVDPRVFQGYRLLKEAFAFPERMLFFRLANLRPALKRLPVDTADIFLLLRQPNRSLEGQLGRDSIALYCTPAINLFPMRGDRIQLSDEASEFQVIPDKTRPLDFEVFGVEQVEGIGAGNDARVDFQPLYSPARAGDRLAGTGYYTTRRLPRIPSERQRRRGGRTGYLGSEVYIAVSTGGDLAVSSDDMRQLAVKLLCTNRDLPLMMPVGAAASDFTLEGGAPVLRVQCLRGPSRPAPSRAGRRQDWEVINHLTFGYLSLVDSDEQAGAASLRDLLRLYIDENAAGQAHLVDGVRSVATRPIIRRVSTIDRLAFGRGIEVTLTVDDTAFEGHSPMILAAALEQFMARYATINSFTETVLRTVQRAEVMRWPARPGNRQIL